MVTWYRKFIQTEMSGDIFLTWLDKETKRFFVYNDICHLNENDLLSNLFILALFFFQISKIFNHYFLYKKKHKY